MGQTRFQGDAGMKQAPEYPALTDMTGNQPISEGGARFRLEPVPKLYAQSFCTRPCSYGSLKFDLEPITQMNVIRVVMPHDLGIYEEIHREKMAKAHSTSSSSSLWAVRYSPGPTPVTNFSQEERCDRSAVLLICAVRRSACLDLYLDGLALATSFLDDVIIIESSRPAQYAKMIGSCYPRVDDWGNVKDNTWREVHLRMPVGLESRVFAVILYGEETVEDSAEGGQNERMMMISSDLHFISAGERG